MEKINSNLGINENWEWLRIQEIAKVVNGYSFDSKDFSSKNSIKFCVPLISFGKEIPNGIKHLVREKMNVKINNADGYFLHIKKLQNTFAGDF